MGTNCLNSPSLRNDFIWLRYYPRLVFHSLTKVKIRQVAGSILAGGVIANTEI
jgi:hypothetical protein